MTTSPDFGIIPEWTLGDRLRKVRVTLDLTQAEFATRIGVKPSSIKQWETDRSRPRTLVAVAKRIELSTGVPAAWVLGIENPPRPTGPGGDDGCATRDSNPQPSDPKVVPLAPKRHLPTAA